MNQCKTCRYFSPCAFERGVCRAKPPVVMPDRETVWPIVEEGDWCGAYREKGQRPVDDRELGID